MNALIMSCGMRGCCYTHTIAMTSMRKGRGYCDVIGDVTTPFVAVNHCAADYRRTIFVRPSLPVAAVVLFNLDRITVFLAQHHGRWNRPIDRRHTTHLYDDDVLSVCVRPTDVDGRQPPSPRTRDRDDQFPHPRRRRIGRFRSKSPGGDTCLAVGRRRAGDIRVRRLRTSPSSRGRACRQHSA